MTAQRNDWQLTCNKITLAAITVGFTLLGGGVTFMARESFVNYGHRAESESRMVALEVKAQEMAQVRSDISAIQGELRATRVELLDAIKSQRVEGFTLAEWSREKNLLETRLKGLEDANAATQRSVDRIEQLLTTYIERMEVNPHGDS